MNIALLNPKPIKKSTTIRISSETKQKLMKVAKYGESMDDIINNLFRNSTIEQPKEKYQKEEKEIFDDTKSDCFWA